MVRQFARRLLLSLNRQRIFRATQESNLKKVRSLQKLILKSHSNCLVSTRRVTQISTGRKTPGMDKLVIKTPAARGRMVDHLAHRALRLITLQIRGETEPIMRIFGAVSCENRSRSLPICQAASFPPGHHTRAVPPHAYARGAKVTRPTTMKTAKSSSTAFMPQCC